MSKSVRQFLNYGFQYRAQNLYELVNWYAKNEEKSGGSHLKKLVMKSLRKNQ
jgi:hypothetical protein